MNSFEFMKTLFLFILTLLVSTVTSFAAVDEKAVVETYANVVHQLYHESHSEASLLEKEVKAFLAEPTEEGLEHCKEQWKKARVPYLQTEVFRFYEGPIDDEDGPEGLLNAWPIDEAFLDYVKGKPDSGLIQDTASYPVIASELLLELNEKGGEANVCTGYHALEFLLWGQDLSTDSAGKRPFTDYTTAKNAERRAAALLGACELLISQLKDLKGEWVSDSSSNYRAEFTAEPKQSLQKILTGVTMLTGFEMASERLAVAYDTQEQEDEHSCFSDTTNQDIVYNLVGIQNVWEGKYGEISGPGLKDWAASVDSEKAQKISESITRSVEEAKAIPVPFDQAFIDEAEGRPAILKLMETLEEQKKYLEPLATK